MLINPLNIQLFLHYSAVFSCNDHRAAVPRWKLERDTSIVGCHVVSSVDLLYDSPIVSLSFSPLTQLSRSLSPATPEMNMAKYSTCLMFGAEQAVHCGFMVDLLQQTLKSSEQKESSCSQGGK